MPGSLPLVARKPLQTTQRDTAKRAIMRIHKAAVTVSTRRLVVRRIFANVKSSARCITRPTATGAPPGPVAWHRGIPKTREIIGLAARWDFVKKWIFVVLNVVPKTHQ